MLEDNWSRRTRNPTTHRVCAENDLGGLTNGSHVDKGLIGGVFIVVWCEWMVERFGSWDHQRLDVAEHLLYKGNRDHREPDFPYHCFEIMSLRLLKCIGGSASFPQDARRFSAILPQVFRNSSADCPQVTAYFPPSFIHNGIPFNKELLTVSDIELS
jgi:hypothetical protein